jgi:hypothetical protein
LGLEIIVRGENFLTRRTVGVLAALVVTVTAFVPKAGASATLLLEEPYGKLGFFSATGHSAVYLSGICAETPLVLRRCAPGEIGAVLSRYNGVGRYDWIAIPLVPYLYAVENPKDVPLFADAKMVAFLRDRYRRNYLEDVAPDSANGETPGGNWYELVGSSYDRTIYGFEIETTAEQDEALILKYNSWPNRSQFRTVSRNCADFAKDVINFYQPKALHRSYIADFGITTPKQMAKTLVKYSTRHSELRLSRTIIPQVPGSVARSTAVHGVVESFFKSKKYIVPSAVVSPLGREDLRAYRKALEHLVAGTNPGTSAGNAEKVWARLQSKATAGLDQQGRPVLQMNVGAQLVSVGESAENVLTSGTPPQLVQALLKARLKAELQRNSPPRVSEREIARDWKLLEQALGDVDPQVTARAVQRPVEPSAFLRSERSNGNRP